MDNLEALCRAIAATAEVVGTQVSGNAIAVMAEDLSDYPLQDALQALSRVRRECNRLTLAEVFKRLPNGWPGADEAWASFPKDEAETGVVTQEASQAWAVALPLWEDGDKIGARMAFRESYDRLVASTDKKRPQWTVTLGWDTKAREAPILKAVECGKIGRESVTHLLPAPESQDYGPVVGLLTGKVSCMPQDKDTRARLRELADQLARSESEKEAARASAAAEERRKLADRKREINEQIEKLTAGEIQ